MTEMTTNKNRVPLAAGLALSVLLAACGSANPPACDDAAATKLLEQLVIEQLMNTYATLNSPYAAPTTYQQLKHAVAQGSDFLADALRRTEDDGSKLQVSIGAIRVRKKDDEIQRVQCVADVEIRGFIDDNTVPIGYAVQYLERGSRLHVELLR
ncbi:MAG: hypothetical protein KJZ96_16620 [Rhodocyclaceae bacterium]|nr:hypothetical protein [Rhodocyclaceae bacterium]